MRSGLKAENYLLTCLVGSIPSHSKQTRQIFQTSAEHPNARINITTLYVNKRQHPVSGSLDFLNRFKPRRPTAITGTISDENVSCHTRCRKRSAIVKYDNGDSHSDCDYQDESCTKKKKRKVSIETKDRMPCESKRSRIKGSTRVLEATYGTPSVPRRKEEKTSRTPLRRRQAEAHLDQLENEELYDKLQKQVTINLLKRRYPCLAPKCH